jgi:hypothetical protein
VAPEIFRDAAQEMSGLAATISLGEERGALSEASLDDS